VKEKILITAALPYANGAIHFGHLAGAYLPADCYARFKRQEGNDVLFICGSDEYGIAITFSAEAAGRTPQQHVDIFHNLNKKLFEKMELSFDHYSRTTWKGHVESTYQYFQDLKNNGYIEERETEQLYSEKDGKFLADRYVVGTCPKCGFEAARGDECTKCGASFEAQDLKNPRSKISGAPLILKKTKHWYLRLDLFREKLLLWLEKKAWKPNVINFIKSYIQDLKPRAITRDTSWGIPLPLPGTEGKVLYVWFDAPIGYISATRELGELRGNKELWREWWCDEKTRLIQFIGKDNIPFHAVIFPAMTMGQNLPIKLVDELPANEFYNLEGKQFSKSDKWYIDLEDFLLRYSADQIRYAILSNAPETQDSEFTWKDFQARVNSDLVGKFGNFINRTLVFIRNNLGTTLPKRGALAPEDEKFLSTLRTLAGDIKECFSTFRVRKACALIMEMAAAGNVYFDMKKPWVDAKDASRRLQMETTLSCLLECAKLLALVSSPVIPDSADKIWKMLGFEKALSSLTWDEIIALAPETMKIGDPLLLFRKIEDEEIEKELEKFKVDHKQGAPQKALVTIDDVRKIELRTGRIVSADKIEKSKKLLKLAVDLGTEVRQIVAGIGASYEPEALIGKDIVVVANLESARLMGVESQGMVLVASSPDGLKLLEAKGASAGSLIS
jgi:methionyl-tRNA synthetase